MAHCSKDCNNHVTKMTTQNNFRCTKHLKVHVHLHGWVLGSFCRKPLKDKTATLSFFSVSSAQGATSQLECWVLHCLALPYSLATDCQAAGSDFNERSCSGMWHLGLTPFPKAIGKSCSGSCGCETRAAERQKWILRRWPPRLRSSSSLRSQIQRRSRAELHHLLGQWHSFWAPCFSWKEYTAVA